MITCWLSRCTTPARPHAAANVVVFFLMLHFIRRPMPATSAYGGSRVPVAAVLPNPATIGTFLAIAGPVLGVVVLKVVLFGMIAARAAQAGAVVSAGHQIIFSAPPTSRANHLMPPPHDTPHITSWGTHISVQPGCSQGVTVVIPGPKLLPIVTCARYFCTGPVPALSWLSVPGCSLWPPLFFISSTADARTASLPAP